MSFIPVFLTKRFVGRSVRTLIAVAILAGFTIPATMANAQDVTPAFDVPGHSRGAAWAWDMVWVGGVGERGDWIWAYDPVTGEVLDSIQAPVPDCLSLEGHENGLVYLSSRSNETYFITRDGVSSFQNPFRHFAGLGSDGDNLWGATFFDPQGMLFKMDMNGRVLHTVPFGGTQSRDMAYLKGRIYVADLLTQNVRVVDPQTGRLIRNIVPPGMNPSGVASDGEGLWLLDEGDNKSTCRVYHIAIRPEGGMRLSSLQHNFGSVVVDDNSDWVLWIYNDGPRTTRLVNFESRDGNDDIFIPHVWAFPETIEAGDSAALRISFVPAYQDSVHIFFALTYDLDRVENIVDVRGKGVRQQKNIILPNRNFSFGLAYYGLGLRNSNMRNLTIENNGGEPLTIRDIRFSNNSYLYGGIELPHTFDQPGAYTIPIFFRPTTGGDIRATGTVVSDDPDSPEINFSLSGTAQLYSYPGGTPLWSVSIGDDDNLNPKIRALLPLDDATGDGLSDVIVASNDHTIACYHAASTLLATPFWSYNTNINPWRGGIVTGKRALCEGSDWNRDGKRDFVFGLDGGALTVVALSGSSGRELWKVDTHGLPGYGGIPMVVQATDDFNGDDVNDVYVVTKAVNEDHTTEAVFLIDGRSARVTWFSELPDTPFDAEEMGDVTGDGVPDIIVALEDGRVIGFDGREGNAIYESHIEGILKSLIKCSDVNRDGSQDLAIATFNHGIYMLNGSNGATLWHKEGMEEVTLLCLLNDLNGDGSDDLIFGTIRSYFMAIDGRTGEDAWRERFLVGAMPLSLTRIQDFSRDGLDDFMVGTQEGRVYALSGNGRDALWSYSNVHEGHGFATIVASADIDGNNQMDVIAAMENGTVIAFAGSYIGNNSIEIGGGLIPNGLVVNPAYPNPFNSTVSIPFSLETSGDVSLRVYDLGGREIFDRSTSFQKPGNHRFIWNGADISGQPVGSGTYFIRVEGVGGSSVKQVQLVR